jgi:hypothetical protein
MSTADVISVKTAWMRAVRIVADDERDREAEVLLDELALPSWADAALLISGALMPVLGAPSSEDEMPGAAVRALSVVVTLLNAEILPGTPVPADWRLHATVFTQRILGIYRTEQAAADAAVSQCGGHEQLPLREWQVGCLADSATAAPQEVLHAAALACGGARHPRRWAYARGVGFVLFRSHSGAY